MCAQVHCVYNPATWLTNLLTVNGAAATLAQASYTYDTVGNRRTMTTPEGAHTYGYDPLDELTSADYPPSFAFADAAFTYDHMGNRTQVTQGSTTLYSPNALNQYASVGGVSLTYDANGNLTSDGTRTYTYDSENQLVGSSAVGSSASYTYDPFGRRLTKTVNGTTTRFLYDGDQFLAETDSAGTITASWLYGPGIDPSTRPDGFAQNSAPLVGAGAARTPADGVRRAAFGRVGRFTA